MRRAAFCSGFALMAAIAIALGHAPLIIPAKPSESWNSYSDRVFGLSTDEWHWCFGGGWAVYDNTPKGAAKRIRYLIANDAPPPQYVEKGCAACTDLF